MPNRSIFVKAKDIPVWEAAKAKAKREGTSMSRVIEDGLRKWVEKRERELGIAIKREIR
jgi:hypothetical protein